MAEFFYTVSPTLHRVARLEKGVVVELDFEIPDQSPSLLGGIFLGRVIEIQKPFHFAFVDVGEEKPGMLPLREGKLPSLKQGESIVVQVSRTANPFENKGVRLTRMITLSLGPLLYTPFMPGLSFSKRLKERHALKTFFDIQPEEGLVVRHWASMDDPFSTLLGKLRREWESIQGQLPAKPTVCLSSPPTLLARVLRSLGAMDTLMLDDHMLASQTEGVATFSRKKVFDERCEEAWESLHSPEVPLLQGGNLYIEETRGLIVMDVNRGGARQNLLSFNRGAILEAFRQIRLRELGGKIVIDLIDASKEEKLLLQDLTFPSDLEVWGISSIGLLEMIRRRKRLSLPQRLKLHLN